jgi:hypothetical protein
MTDRRKSKKTFIRYAGKVIFAIDCITLIDNLILQHLGLDTSGFGQMYTFETFITGFIFGAAGWSDSRKDKNIVPTPPPDIKEP